MARSKRTVLLVDPDPNVTQQVRLQLHQPDCRVEVADTPDVTWQERPDLVLLAQPLGGRDSSPLIASFVAQGCAVVVLASGGSVVSHVRSVHLGAWDYLHKPLDPELLARRVNDMFRRLAQGQRPAPVEGPARAKLLGLLERVARFALSGALSCEHPGMKGYLLFDLGKLQRAELGSLQGDAALTVIASRGDWTLAFKEENEDTDATPTAKVQRHLTARARAPKWSPATTREVFYGPPLTTPVDGEDPHAAATRRNVLPPSEVAGTVVESPRGIDSHPTREMTSSPGSSTEEILAALDSSTTQEFVDEGMDTSPLQGKDSAQAEIGPGTGESSANKKALEPKQNP